MQNPLKMNLQKLLSFIFTSSTLYSIQKLGKTPGTTRSVPGTSDQASMVEVVSPAVDGYGQGQVAYLHALDALTAQVFKGDDLRVLDPLGDQRTRAAPQRQGRPRRFSG